MLLCFKCCEKVAPLVINCLYRGEHHICTGIVEHLWVKRPCICCNGKESGCYSGGYTQGSIFNDDSLIGGETTLFKCEKVRVGVGFATFHIETGYYVVLVEEVGEVALYAV